MDDCNEYNGAGRMKPGFGLPHTPPSVYDEQEKEYLKRSRLSATVDEVTPMDNVNDGVSTMHTLRTPQVMPATMPRCPYTSSGNQLSLNTVAVSNRKQKCYDDNRDRRICLGKGCDNRPLWQNAATSAGNMELSAAWKRICNSTSSVFASSTISAPSTAELMLCVSAVVKIQLDHDVGAPEEVRKQFPYFEQQLPDDSTDVPTLEAVNIFVHDMFIAGGFSPECNIIALVYINRVIANTGLPVHKYNWRGILCAAYLLAQKVWDDSSLNTASFAQLFPIFTLEQVRKFENEFIFLLDFQATVTSELYARYYFELRELFEQLQKGNEDLHVTFPLKPLEMWRAKKLQLVSDSFRMQRRYMGRGSASSDSSPRTGQPKSTQSALARNRGMRDDPPGPDMSDYPTQALDDHDISYIPRGRYVQS